MTKLKSPCIVKKSPNYHSRKVWAKAFGKPAKGLFVCHHCDNPYCCNINHLFLGTHKQNMEDMKSKERQKKSKKFTKEDAIYICNSSETQRKLAKLYDCSQAMIWLIKHGKRVWDGKSQR